MKNVCPGSRKYISKSALAEDGKLHYPVCQAVVGATEDAKVKVHRPGEPTRVVTGGGRMGNYQ